MTAGESVWLSHKAAERAGGEQRALKTWPWDRKWKCKVIESAN